MGLPSGPSLMALVVHFINSVARSILLVSFPVNRTCRSTRPRLIIVPLCSQIKYFMGSGWIRESLMSACHEAHMRLSPLSACSVGKAA